MRRRPLLYTALLHMSLVVICLVTLYPVLWVVKMALSPEDGLSLSANPLPQAVTFEHFRTVLGASEGPRNTRATLWRRAGAVPLTRRLHG